MKAVVFTGEGGNEVVRVLERPDPSPGPEDVVVAAAVAGMNPADLHQRDGHYPAPPGAVADVPGLEVSGEVAAVGERVSAWKAGDRVFGLVGGGGLATRVLVHERCVVAVPGRLTDEEAAAVPEAFITAHDALVQAGTRPGERVLVRGASGSVGRAATQLAAAAGATVVGDGDEGPVDVVIDCVGGAGVAQCLEMLAPRGRIVVVSVAAGAEVPLNLMRLMSRRATIRGTMLRARPLEEKAAAVQAFGREVVPLLADGRAVPAIDSVVELARIGDAFDRLAERGKAGKVLVRMA